MDKIEQRNAEVVEDYTVHHKPIDEIAREIGRGAPLVRQILREAGVTLRPRCSVSRKSPVSPLHQRIGLMLYDRRFDSGMTSKQVADDINVSVTKLNLIEQGVCEVELLTLQDIAAYLGISVSEILKETP